MKINIERLLITLLLLLVAGIPAIHKLMGDIPPEWFQNKFGKSLIGMAPGGITGSYLIIILLEIAVPVLLIIGAVRGEWYAKEIGKFTEWGFSALMVLFVILFFGSFLVEDYSNGFFDFTYFVGVILLKWRYREVG